MRSMHLATSDGRSVVRGGLRARRWSAADVVVRHSPLRLICGESDAAALAPLQHARWVDPR